jgi:predicted transcriptional regulator
MARQQNDEVREFILQNVEANPNAMASMAAKEFSLTRTTIARYMTRLVNEGLITAVGNTRARQYALRQNSPRR